MQNISASTSSFLFLFSTCCHSYGHRYSPLGSLSFRKFLDDVQCNNRARLPPAFADAEAATTATTLISNSLDLAIAASIAEFEKVQMTQQLTQIEDSVLNETILQSAQTQSSAEAEAEAAAEAAAKEEEVMRAIRLNEEEEEIRLLIEISKKAQEEEDANISEAKMIEMALKASASGGGGGGGDDDDVQMALYANMLQK
ncbi:hypothetical protein ScalyP_jg467 [Parmales sp. scaly parma]|nr:hypothetical protein ScalyP_jg467 [Parmales sp. scaly parma]